MGFRDEAFSYLYCLFHDLPDALWTQLCRWVEVVTLHVLAEAVQQLAGGGAMLHVLMEVNAGHQELAFAYLDLKEQGQGTVGHPVINDAHQGTDVLRELAHVDGSAMGHGVPPLVIAMIGRGEVVQGRMLRVAEDA